MTQPSANYPANRSQPPLPEEKSPTIVYLIAIFVGLLLIGGLVWFLVKNKNQPAIEPPPPPPPTTSNQLTAPMIDIPAPPSLDARADTQIESPTKAAIPTKSLCSSPCDATAPAALSAALRSAGSASRGCYERALRTQPTLQGKMTVAVRVASNGNVCSASVINDSVGSSQVASCVSSLFTGKRFPAATGGRCVDVHVPLSFTPRQNN